MGDGVRKTAARKTAARKTAGRKTAVRKTRGQRHCVSPVTEKWDAPTRHTVSIDRSAKSSQNTGDDKHAGSFQPRLASKKWYEQLRTKSTDELLGEYATLESKPETAKRKAWEKMAGMKMRHKAVVLYDETRVVLKNGPAGDFIHASFVDGWGERKRAWIIAMAPMPDTFPDFWHMVWQEQVPVIVMLCQLREPNVAGKVVEKCSQYWPAGMGERLAAGPYKVECEKTYLDAPVCEGQKIQVSALWLWFKGSRRRVFHYQYQSWGDHGVPSSQKAMVHFSKLVEAQWREMAVIPHYKSSSPILVHCSAGVGRSGTFVGVCNAIKGLGTTPAFSVMDVVRRIREQRFNAVQTDQQYVYIYQCLVAFLKKSGIIAAHSPSPVYTGSSKTNDAKITWLTDKLPRHPGTDPNSHTANTTQNTTTQNSID